jgi:hypothetical protein
MTKRALALVAFIFVVALVRLLPHPSNFAPITAMAVFGGVRFRNRIVAVFAPLLALLLSDMAHQVLCAYGLTPDWGFYKGMWVVYGTTALIVLMASVARGTRSPWIIAATTLAGSCIFFVVTNFAVWAGGGMYPQTLEGLGMCYAAGLPFFGNGVLGDLTFATVLFGAWALAEATIPALAPVPTKQ